MFYAVNTRHGGPMYFDHFTEALLANVILYWCGTVMKHYSPDVNISVRIFTKVDTGKLIKWNRVYSIILNNFFKNYFQLQANEAKEINSDYVIKINVSVIIACR